ncbi:MAG: hypothetical protein A2Z09_02935 [Nitrospirae bacterium RBG_16_43_8]|nr:MAG: hypothetical protein A2Z09_02935 [Nitrospirae bacterium RBG_16_43_8]
MKTSNKGWKLNQARQILMFPVAALLICLAFMANASAGELEDKLLKAAFDGQTEVVRELLKNGADANAKNNFGTALILASSIRYQNAD